MQFSNGDGEEVDELEALTQRYVPSPPGEPRPLSPPGKMAKPSLHPLNSFAVSVEWTPPADLYSRRARSVVALAHSACRERDLPVLGYRLRCWTQIDEADPDGEPLQFIDVQETWGLDSKNAVLKWLEMGTGYIFEVMAFNAAGDGPWSDPSEYFLMPELRLLASSAEMGVCARTSQEDQRPIFLSNAPDSIEINWSMPCHRGSTIRSYDFLCSKDPDFGEALTKHLQLPGDSTKLFVGELEPNTVYYFKYCAHNEKGSSGWSPRTPGVATMAQPPAMPAPPTQLGGSSASRPCEISITWNAPESHNIPIQHYLVQCSMDPNMLDAILVPFGGEQKSGGFFGEYKGDALSAPSSPSARRPGFSKGHYALTQMRIRGLRPSSTYYFQVKAANQIGESPWSHPSLPMCTIASPPARCEPPRFISGSRYAGIRICWPVPESYGASIKCYDVRVAEHVMMIGATEFFNISVSATYPGIRDVVKGLPKDAEIVEATAGVCPDPGSVLFCQVRAGTAAGTSDWSDSSEAMLVAAEKPLTPAAPHQLVPLPRTIVVRWLQPDSQGSPIIRYRLRYDLQRDMMHAVEFQGLKGSNLEFAVAGLKPHVSYFFQVCAINAVGQSDWSLSSMPATVMQVPPTKMGAPFLVGHTSTSITVGFSPPADLGTLDGEMVSSYILRYADGPDRLTILSAAGGADPRLGLVRGACASGVEVGGLKPGTLCAYQVSAVNEFGESELSDIAEISTNAAPPEAPDPPQMVEFTSWSISLSITLACDNGAAITNYGLEVQELGGGSWELPQQMVLSDALMYYSINRLKPGTRYSFRARSVNSNGTSAWSEASQECKTQPIPPCLVNDLVAQEVTQTSYCLSWTPPYDNGAEVTEYRVQWSSDADFIKHVTEVVVKETLAHGDGSKPGVPSYARVAAGNSEGWSSFGEVLMTILAPGVPLAPTKPRVTDVGPIHAMISWVAPYGCGSEVIAFWILYEETATDGRPDEERDRGKRLFKNKKTKCVIEPLFSEREYVCQLAAENEFGLSPYSEPCKPWRVAAPGVPTAPGMPIFVSNTTSSIVMRWDEPESMGAEILDQLVHVSIDRTFPDGRYLEVWVLARSTSLAKKESNECSVSEVGFADTGPLTTICGGFAGSSSTIADSLSHPAAIGLESLEELPHDESRKDGDNANRVVLDEELEDVSTTQPSEEAVVDRTPWEEPASDQAYAKLGEHQNAIAKSVLEDHQQQAPKDGSCAELDQSGLSSVVVATTRRISNRIPKISEYEMQGLTWGTLYYFKVASSNVAGLGPFGPVSERMPTDVTIPAPILQDPGLVLLRRGCTTLTFGWQRPKSCGGAPITHYVVRYATTDAGLWADDFHESLHDETSRETWPGIANPQPIPPGSSMNQLDLEDKETIIAFVGYLMLRFGSLEGSWEWLDVNGNGDVSKSEFLEGDADTGSPFQDFDRQDVLLHVWDLLDSDAGGSIGMNEYNKLRPYMEVVQKGAVGVSYDGVYCLLPSLIPGQAYHVMVRAVNQAGMSSWSQCLTGPHTTYPMTPSKMAPLEGVPKRRTVDSVTLRWQLPCNNGDAVANLEVRYIVQDVEEGALEKNTLRKATLLKLGPAPCTGHLQTEMTLSGLLPGQLVFAIARAFNSKGGSREWSDLPGTGSGRDDSMIAWDCSTLQAAPATPQPPVWDADSFRSGNSRTIGSFYFEIRRNNGLPFTAFGFRLLDSMLLIVREWESAADEDTMELRKCPRVHRPMEDLFPGEVYSLCVYAKNSAGSSPWSSAGDPIRTPADVPQISNALLSEIQSLTWVELKWFPPHDNGGAILRYDVRTSMHESAAEEEWRTIDKDELAKNTRPYAADGRRPGNGRDGALVFTVDGLDSGVKHFFMIRTCNCIGWSEWSDVAHFRTTPAKPAIINTLAVAGRGARELQLVWEAPETHGLDIERYDFVGGSNLQMVRWVQIITLLLATTVDLDKLFNFEVPCGLELGEVAGSGRLADLLCDETIYSPLHGSTTSFNLAGLLPGQSYYFMTRALTDAGKGEFSTLLGPVLTLPEKPGKILPLELVSFDENMCSLRFKLPYDMGSPIIDARVVLSRADGPLSADELHPETGKCMDHIAGQTLTLQFGGSDRVPPVLSPLGQGECSGRWLHGCTLALRRAYENEGIDNMALLRDRHRHAITCITGRAYQVTFEDLRPGTQYEVQWSCRNVFGESDTENCEAIALTTCSRRPDTPGPFTLSGM